MNAFSVIASHQEGDRPFITKLASNTEVVGTLVCGVESRVGIFRKDLVQERILTSKKTLTDISFFQSSSSEIACSTLDGVVEIWDLRAKDSVRSIKVDENGIPSIAVGSSDRVLATAVRNKVVLTDIGTGKTLHRLEDHTK